MAKNPTERLWLVGGGLGAFVLLLIGYFFFISPQRSNTADLESQATTAREQNGTLSSRIDALTVQNKDLAKYQAQLLKAHAALPTTSGLSDFLRTLQAIGSATSTNVTSLTVGAPTNVSAVAGAGSAAAPAPGSAAHSGAAASAAAGAGGAAGAAGATTGSRGSTGSTGAATGIFGLPITAVVSGSTTSMNMFLQQLQSVQPRAVLITALTQGDAAAGTKASSGTGMQMTITMQAFVAPVSAAENANLAKAANR